MRGAGNTYRGPGLPVLPAPPGAASIALADAAAAAEALAVAVTLAAADVAAGSDQAAAAVTAPLADAAAAAEGATAAAATALADVSAAADQRSASVAASLAESVGGAEAPAATATVLTSDTAGAADAVAVAVPKTATLQDAFAVNDLATLWAGSTGTVTWAPGQAGVQCDTSYDSALRSAAAYDLTGSSFSARLVNYAAASAQTYIALIVPSFADNITAGVQGTGGSATSFFNYYTGATTFAFSTPYDPVNHAFYRVRESGGTVFFDAAPDGITWSNLYSVSDATLGFPLTSLLAGVSAGDFGSDPAGTSFASYVNVTPAVPSDAAGARESVAVTVSVPLAEAAGAADAGSVPAETLPLADAAGGAETSPRQTVGAYLSNMYRATGDFTAQNALWATLTGTPGAAVTRYYKGLSDFTYSADMTEMVAAGVKICLTLRPAYNPVSSADLAAMTVLLQALSGAGATVDVALWHEPYFGGLTSTQFTAMIAYYGPAVRAYFPLVFVASGPDTVLANGFYPGDAAVDKIAADQYAFGAVHPDPGSSIGNCAAIADAATPPKPLGLWEFNGSTDAVNGQAQAFVTTWWGDVQSFFAARAAAGKPNADVLIFNSGTGNFLGNATNQNCGFEGGLGGWVTNANCAIAQTGAQAYEGTGALAVTSSAAGNMSAASCAAGSITTQGLPCNPGDTVVLGGQSRPASAAGRGVHLGVQWFTAAGGFISTVFAAAAVPTPAGVWTPASATLTAPGTAGFARLLLQWEVPAAGGEVHYLDNPFLYVAAAATSLTTTIWSAKDYRIALWDAMATALAVPRAAPRLPAAVTAPLADSAGAADALTVAVSVAVTEQAGAAEAQPRMLPEPAGAAADALAVAAAVPVADPAAGAEAAAGQAAAPLAEQAAAADAGRLSAVALPMADTAGAADATGASAAAQLADSAGGTEAPAAAATAGPADRAGAAEMLVPVPAVGVADTAAASDGLAVVVASPAADAAAAAEAQSAGVTSAAGDQGAAADAISTATGALFTLADAAGAAEAVTAAAAAQAADTGAGADVLAVGEAPAAADRAAAADAQDVTVNLPLAEAGAAADGLATAAAAQPVPADSAGVTDALSATAVTHSADTGAAGDILVTGAAQAVTLADRAGAADAVVSAIPPAGPAPAWQAGAARRGWRAVPAPRGWAVDAAAPGWLAVASPSRWAAAAAGREWVMIMAQFRPIASVSQADVNVTWTSDLGGAVTDPTPGGENYPVRFAFPASSGDEQHPAQPAAWLPGHWVLPNGQYKGFIAQCPVGPTALGGLVQLAAGQSYDVWSEVDTGTETVREFAGVQQVY